MDGWIWGGVGGIVISDFDFAINKKHPLRGSSDGGNIRLMRMVRKKVTVTM